MLVPAIVKSPGRIEGQPFRDDDPLFTVIVTDYEPSVSRDFLRRKMACLAAQTCDDFEVLVYHDGPKAQSYADDLAGGPMHPATTFIETPARVGDWGHSARDLGIRAARGRWIIHTNADNIFYPTLIEVLKAALTAEEPWTYVQQPARTPLARMVPVGLKGAAAWLEKQVSTERPAPLIYTDPSPEILIYGIILQGAVAWKGNQIRVREVAGRQGILSSGMPAAHYGRIDAMQLVMKRELWLAEGGWHLRTIDSDALLYSTFARKYRVLAVPAVLGEHW